MKIEIHKGCYNESIRIDGELLDEEDQFTPFKALEIVQNIIKKDPIYYLKVLSEHLGTEEWDKCSCEQCGHTSSKVTYEIE